MRSSRSRGARLAVGLTMLAVFGGACTQENGGTAAPPPADTGEVTVGATEFEFDPATISVTSGDFTIVLVNEGDVEHDFLIEGVDDPEAPHEELIYAARGQSDRGDYDLDDGTYTFYCSIPGHRQAGMEGTLTVG